MIECNVSLLIPYILPSPLKENYYIRDKMTEGLYSVPLNALLHGSLSITHVFCQFTKVYTKSTNQHMVNHNIYLR